jgi:hypothetical protein
MEPQDEILATFSSLSRDSVWKSAIVYLGSHHFLLAGEGAAWGAAWASGERLPDVSVETTQLV